MITERNNLTSHIGLKGCIIIPAYNEGKHIANVVKSAKSYLPTLVIDDGSSDNTPSQAEESGAILYKQEKNAGKGLALKRGFTEALNLGFDYAVTIDADGQHDPNEINKFSELFFTEKNDLIIGYRDFSQMPTTRKFANSIGRASFSWAMGMKILDNQSGYRLLSNRLMRIVLDSPESGFEFEVDMIVNCILNGYSLGWVPIRTIYGEEKSHIHPLKHVFHFFRVVFMTRKKMKNRRAN